MSSSASASSSSPLVGIGWALLSAFAFSTLGIFAKLAPSVGLTSETLLTWRFGIAALALFTLGFGRGVAWRERLVMLAFGPIYTLQTALYFAALSRISAGTAALLLYLAPAFVVVYAWMLGRRPGAAQVGAVALTLVGLAVVIGLPSDSDRGASGLLLGVLTAMCYGAYLLGSERYLGRLAPFTVTAHVALGATVGFGLLGAAQGRLDVPSSLEAWGVVVACVIFPTLLALPSLFAAISRLGAARASIIATTEPVWTAVLAALVLGEAWGTGLLVGGALILLGAVLAQCPGRAR
ncbi:DMT family transporter [Deinococcus yavapaiensis]|uniref:Threonine/homoserine efflux transporter RhtA n=1 Tax=Deinococcus yavapaiensis KR-236 TaxID=694435 RepID=A0A318SIW8_9DEIO|nr:DMT family transporter [Deinococcus yavapaiensis]PYE51863.1 threonine/homoserine efflux transporter RhtA [Deinococcus yavapaiensis KR-236]